MEISRDQPEASAQEQTRKRPGDGDIEFLQRARRITRDAGESAEDIQRDGLHGNLVLPGDDAVAELVKQQRTEKQDAGDDAQRPVLLRGPAGMQRGELLPKRYGDQQKDDDPAG